MNSFDPALIILIISVMSLLVLLLVRVPVGGALLGIGILGVTYVQGFGKAIALLKVTVYHFAASWALTSLPMYLMMGYFVYHMGIAEKLFNVARLLFHRINGSLAIATAFGCAAFGSVSGSGFATTATFVKLALPEMKRDKYDRSLAVGVTTSSGGMGSLMPPSLLMILYASLAEVPIAQCFIAGVFPCLLEALSFSTYIFVRCKLNPSLAPKSPRINVTPRLLLSAFISLWDVYIILAIIFGGIYGGFVTATEAGALSAFATFAMGMVTRRLNWGKIKNSVVEALRVTGTILIIALGAQLFVSFLTFAGVHEFIGNALSGTSRITFLLYIFILYLFLGMLLDTVGMMFLTVPVLLPILPTVGVSPILFCILFVKVAELGGITPPVGMGVYLVNSMLKEEYSLGQIFKGCLPFAVSQSVNFWILVLFPSIALFLPKLIYG